jgi:hypothetical protein
MSCRLPRSRAGFLVAQSLWGITLLAAPRQVLQVIGGASEERTPQRVMRVLGARHVAQAIAEHVFGDPAVRLGVWVDGLHALTGVGFACADARWRGAALADAAITSGFAAYGLSDIGATSRAAPT